MKVLNNIIIKNILIPFSLITIIIFVIYKDIFSGSAILNSDFFNYFNNFVILKKQIELNGFYTFGWYWKELLGFPANYQLNSNFSVLHNFYLLICVLLNLDLKNIFYYYQIFVISALGLTSYCFFLFLNKSIFKIDYYLSLVGGLFLLTAFTLMSFLNAAGLIFSLLWTIIFFVFFEKFYETQKVKYLYLIIFSFFQIVYCLAFEYLYFSVPLFIYLILINKRYLLIFNFLKKSYKYHYFVLSIYILINFLPLLTIIDFFSGSLRNAPSSPSNNFDIYWNFFKININYYFFYGYHLIICFFTSVLLFKHLSQQVKYILLLNIVYFLLLLGNKTIFYNFLEAIPFFSSSRSMYKISPFILICLILLYVKFFQEIKINYLNYKKIFLVTAIINLLYYLSPGKNIFDHNILGIIFLNIFIFLFFLSFKFKSIQLILFIPLLFSIIAVDKKNFSFKYNLNDLSFIEKNKIDIFLENEYLKNDFRVIYSTPLIQHYITSIKNYENLYGYQSLSYQYSNMIGKDTEKKPEIYNVKYFISTDSNLKERYPKLNISLKKTILEKSNKILFNFSNEFTKIYIYEISDFKSKYKIINNYDSIIEKTNECIKNSIVSNDKILCTEKKNIVVFKNFFSKKEKKENKYIKKIKNNYFTVNFNEKNLILTSINFHKNLKVRENNKYITTYNINNKLAFLLEEGSNIIELEFEPIFFDINFKIILNLIVLTFCILFCFLLSTFFKLIFKSSN